MVRVQVDASMSVVGLVDRQVGANVCLRIWCFNQPIRVWVQATAIARGVVEGLEERQ